MTALHHLPDDTVVYIPGEGRTLHETTLGEIRATEEEPALDEREATIRMWEDIATRNLLRSPGCPRVGVAAIRASAVSRYANAQTARAST